ncbi:MAG: glycine--tRNA ligase subunit beta, partial [Parvularculaceae bacterium]
MPELLLEILSEEIPARMQARAAKDLERLVNDRLLGAGFLPEGVKAFATPRRLALVATGLPGRQPDRKEEKKGPRLGAPKQALDGFLKSAGLSSLDQCEIREDKKGQFYVAVIDEKGRATADVIAGFVPEIVRGFPWPKSMRWGDGDLRWVRPIHSILCCFDHEIVDVAIDGLKAGDATQGHRFMAPKEIRARTFEKYEAKLRAAKVILDAEARKELIAGDAKTLVEAQGFELVEDEALLAEVAGLAEWPAPMIGSFDEKFLALPDEVLRATMRGHQKYFSVRDPKTERLAAKFVCVANIEAPDGGAAMRAGYERVLTARLSDAWYLYHQDLKVPLKDRVKDLDRVTFFEGLGAVGDKARRVAALAKEIAPAVGADASLAEEAALLAKADLVTGMVYEFPELQGVMGRYYFLAQAGSARARGAAHSSPVYGGGV